ncbi:MAG TPA: tetratricopeptide repeat protein [Pseudomonadales bacterium]|nr:tetratricopeptide repeat protein [Pseudomonadales bacterium]
MIASRLPSCVRLGVWLAAGVALALGLGACASDEAGRRALVETGALRTQMDEVKQREENTARDLARVQSQLRALEADAAEKTREIRAAGVELARARVLLEEARTELRERAAASPPAPVAMPVTPTRDTTTAPVEPAPAPVTPPSPPPSPSVIPPHTVPVVPPRAAAKPPVSPPASPRASVTPPAASTPLRPAPAAPPEPGSAARSALSAEQVFSAAMANLRAREPGQAVLELTDLIARFPDHALASSAQLWIGEAYYQQRDYRQSLVELKRMLDGYPKSPQVADALLKTGLCHRALGDGAAARTAWEQVARDHSGSAAAGQARSLLGSRDSAARSGR